MYNDIQTIATRAYLAAAIWTDEHDLNIGTDASLSVYDFSAAAYNYAKGICGKAIAEAIRQGIRLDYSNAEQFGHDLWLSRNGHGAGFFDREDTVYDGQANNYILQDMAEALGYDYLCMTDNQEISFEYCLKA